MRIILLFLCAATALRAGESLEAQISIDGTGMPDSLLLYSGTQAAASVLYSSGDRRLGAGFNGFGISAGKLEGSGLAAEVRRPDHDSLQRLSERTFFHARLRSAGTGFAMSLDRAGLAWERREQGDSGYVWAIPFRSALWSFEALAQAGFPEVKTGKRPWYPGSLPDPGGSAVTAAGRLRRRFPGGQAGVTLMASGGSETRRGWLSSYSALYSTGPAVFRWRAILSSPYFRDANSDRLDIPAGTAFSWRYRPLTGVQAALDAETGHDVSDGTVGSASLSAGWRTDAGQITFSADWNSERSPSVYRFKSQMERDFKHHGFELSGTLEPDEHRKIRLTHKVSFQNHLKLETYTEIHQAAGPVLADCRLTARIDAGQNRVILSVFAGDWPRDWKNGPSSAGDFSARIRWIRKWN